MDFELNEDQRMLAQTVADFAKNESPVERFRRLREPKKDGTHLVVFYARTGHALRRVN